MEDLRQESAPGVRPGMAGTVRSPDNLSESWNRKPFVWVKASSRASVAAQPGSWKSTVSGRSDDLPSCPSVSAAPPLPEALPGTMLSALAKRSSAGS